jgi:hypothetical protein
MLQLANVNCRQLGERRGCGLWLPLRLRLTLYSRTVAAGRVGILLARAQPERSGCTHVRAKFAARLDYFWVLGYLSFAANLMTLRKNMGCG